MSLSFKIALRFLNSSKGQTILIALGIAIGVSVQIFIGSLITGLQKSLIDKTVGNSSQITIVSNSDNKLIDGYSSILDQLNDYNNEITALAVTSNGSAFLNNYDSTYPVLVRGINEEQVNGIYSIDKKIIDGRYPLNINEIIVGKNLKEEASLSLYDEIELITPTGKKEIFKIVGFYDLKVANINNTWLFTTLDTSQKLFEYNNQISSIELKVKDVFMASELASKISSKLNANIVSIENWEVQNEELLSGLKGQSSSSFMIQFFVMISVVLGIASVLAISVVQKSKQLGILKAMGMNNRNASLVFLFQGFLLGIIGGILGILFGLGLSYIFSTFALNPDGTPVVALYLDFNFIMISALLAILASTLAALIPARRSSKLEPMEVIKNG